MIIYVCMFAMNILAIIFMYSILDSRYEKKTKEMQNEIYKELISRDANIKSVLDSLTDVFNSMNEVTKNDSEMIETLDNQVVSLTEELDYVHSQIDDINSLINKELKSGVKDVMDKVKDELVSAFKDEIVNAFKNEAEKARDISKEDSTNEYD